MAAVPLASEQMACRKPIDDNRGVKGTGEGGREGGRVKTRLASSIEAKRKTCLVVLPPKESRTIPLVQVEAEGKRGPTRGSLWRCCVSERLFFSSSFLPFKPTAPLCASKVCKQGSV